MAAHGDHAEGGRGGTDAVIAALDAAALAYRAERARLAGELAEERGRARRQRERAEQLAAGLKEIHRSLFAGDVYALILRACLSITGATRGAYLTCRGADQPLHVRAAVGMAGAAGDPPSPFLEALGRRVLAESDTLVRNEGEPLDGLPAPGEEERFRNVVAMPVVLMRNLDGVVIAGDKTEGDFDEEDVETLLSVGDQAAVAVQNRHLERALQSAYVSTVSMLADAVEAKDPDTHGHCEMASRLARLIAERMGLSERERAVVCYAALLHDVGKIGVSDGVLNKPGPLLPEERELMRAHVRVGHDLLASVPALQPIAGVVLHHHERWDGTGYPDGMRGEEIPLAARIVAVVDAYCAMITLRSYKEAYEVAHARQELERCAGTQFDPRVVELFLAALDSPQARDADGDFYAECGVLPAFAHVRELLDPPL